MLAVRPWSPNCWTAREFRLPSLLKPHVYEHVCSDIHMCACVDLEGTRAHVLGRVWRVGGWGAVPGQSLQVLTPTLHPQGTPADVLYKGTITRIIGEDSPSRLDRSREDGLPKGHVIYEGKKGHVLSYEGE